VGVTLTVREVNLAPAAADDAYQIEEDALLSGTSVLANDRICTAGLRPRTTCR